MKIVTAIVGSPHKGGATYKAARELLDKLEAYGDVRGEIVMLGDYEIGMCRGCKVCFHRGGEHCPLRDDRDAIIEKIATADGVVFASPNYSWGVSGVMKVFFDRIGFMFHRPRFWGKTATSIVVQGIFRGEKIRDYLEFCAGGLGFNVVKGSVIRTLLPMSEKALEKMDGALTKQAERFHARLLKEQYPVPSLFKLALFRVGRAGIMKSAPRDKRDYAFYGEQGWFGSDYYYPTRLGALKGVAGAFCDWLVAHTGLFSVGEEPVRHSAESASSGPAM